MPKHVFKKLCRELKIFVNNFCFIFNILDRDIFLKLHFIDSCLIFLAVMVVIGANISFISFKSITFFFVCVIINAFVVSYIWESSANREEGNKIHFTPNRFLLLCVACLEKKRIIPRIYFVSSSS